MLSIKKLMLGAALVAGVAGLGATTANAAEFRVVVGGPVAYAPPNPGPGYAWVAGYRAGGYWVPGRWNFVGVRGRDHFYRGYHDRRFYRDHDRFRR
jgi:hypothetical protein